VPYSTLIDVQNAAGGESNLIGLADYDEDGVADTAVVDDVIAKADAWIDSFVQRRHTVPVTPTPAVLNMYSADEAVWLLKQRKRQVSVEDRDGHEDRERWLIGIARGDWSLGVDPNPGKSTAVAGEAEDRIGDFTESSRDRAVGLW
jgi:phage gp36-like protein